MTKRKSKQSKKKTSSAITAQEAMASPEYEPLMTPPEDEMAEQSVEQPVEQPSPLVVPALSEYNQVAECPYTTPIITLKIHADYYTIPQYYLRPFDTLLGDPDCLQYQYYAAKPFHLELVIDPQSAHTFVHYLYTGQYETLETSFEDLQTSDDIPEIISARDSIEFDRAVHTYVAAVQYCIPGLRKMAQEFMARFATRLSIQAILRTIRRVYSSLSEGTSACIWLEDFVRGRLSIAFNGTERRLRQMMKEYEVGNDTLFDRFVVDEVLALYEREQDERIATIEKLTNSGHQVHSLDSLRLEPEP
ncbi:hypothetical protein AbraIFM66951_004590, partial [Aspergillus brasiliensis]